MEILERMTIGEYVAKDYRTAAIFKKNDIDFCCNGNQTIQQACIKKTFNTSDILAQIKTLSPVQVNEQPDFDSWPLDLLATYIEKKHHQYSNEKSEVIVSLLDQLCISHGANHPDLFKISNLFKTFTRDLKQHMEKEELLVFPFIKSLVAALITDGTIDKSSINSIVTPTALLMQEHRTEGEIFKQIVQLSNNYTPPSDACNSFKTAYKMLQEFESNLQQHIHLENNILFPKASILEENLRYAI